MHRLKVVDRILTISQDEIMCEKIVPVESPIFEGHFPDYPVVCGALLLEAMSQAGGYMIMNRIELQRMALVVAVRNLRYYHFVRPGDHYIVKVSLRSIDDVIVVADGRIEMKDQCCCKARLTYTLIDFPTPATKSLISTILTQRTIQTA